MEYYYIITSSIFSFNLGKGPASSTTSPACSEIINAPTIIPPSPNTLKLNIIGDGAVCSESTAMLYVHPTKVKFENVKK
jgi:hypothetical protein